MEVSVMQRILSNHLSKSAPEAPPISLKVEPTDDWIGEVTPVIIWCKRNLISRPTLYRLVRSGKLKLLKIGARSYLHKDESRRFFVELLKTNKKGGAK
jgi:hypothetical protein